MAGDVGVAQDGRLGSQLIQAVLHGIADADQAHEPAALEHGQVSDAMARHQAKHARQAVLRGGRSRGRGP